MNQSALTSKFVGTKSRPCTVQLTPRMTMNYAAALGDVNPYYFADDRPEGIVAPPMLAVALTWRLSADFERYWGDIGVPAAVRARQVHYNESITWDRVMACDAPLTIQGEIVAMRPHPSGTLIAIAYEAADRDGERVFRELITGLLRDVALEDGGAGDLPASEKPAAPGPDHWEQAIAIDPLAAHVYDGCAAIEFPIHTSARFARQAGLPGPIYHGTATLGLAVREILNREAAGVPNALAAVDCGFRGMVFPGTTVVLRILASCLENGCKTVYFEVETPEGVRAIRDGRVVLRATP